jgi:hypothetical protein
MERRERKMRWKVKILDKKTREVLDEKVLGTDRALRGFLMYYQSQMNTKKYDYDYEVAK